MLQGLSLSRLYKIVFSAPSFPTWLVSDCRRETDIQYFRETYGPVVKTVRITASDEARTAR